MKKACHQHFMTGAKPSPRYLLLAAVPFIARKAAPKEFAIVPKQIDIWGNATYGCCVTSEEAYAKACWSVYCGLPETFITAQEVVRWANKYGFLNGATLTEVMDVMKRDGLNADGVNYKDGGYLGVNYSDESILQGAIATGPVKIAIDAGALPDQAGNGNGWWSTQGGNFPQTDHCFTGDTKVSLLDGRELSFTELANGDAGETFWVYSCDSNGNVVPGKAHSVRKTRKDAELVKVTLDNGESVRCTKDHRFLMRDGTYKEASLLQAEDSLMPLYRDTSKNGYELYYNPRINGKTGWRATHRMVAFGGTGRSDRMAAHHVDFDKRNNSPDNLRVMTPAAHAALHQKFSEHNKTPEHRAKARKMMSELWADPVWAASQRAKLAASASARGKRTAKLGHAHLQTMSAEERSKTAKVIGAKRKGQKRTAESIRKMIAAKKKRFAEDPAYRETQRANALKAALAAAQKPVTDKQREARRANAQKLNAASRLACANNHKVVSVEACGREDVYDLTVDEHHNFALTAGVFVHNCVGLSGFGSASYCFSALGLSVPAGLPASTTGYLLFTWNSIGFVTYDWIMSTVTEAWVRNPTTPGQTPEPTPVPPIPVPPVPVPPVPPTPVPVPQGYAFVGTPVTFSFLQRHYTPEGEIVPAGVADIYHAKNSMACIADRAAMSAAMAKAAAGLNYFALLYDISKLIGDVTKVDIVPVENAVKQLIADAKAGNFEAVGSDVVAISVAIAGTNWQAVLVDVTNILADLGIKV